MQLNGDYLSQNALQIIKLLSKGLWIFDKDKCKSFISGNGVPVVVGAKESLVHNDFTKSLGEGEQFINININWEEGVWYTMRNPKNVLINLTKHSSNKDYKYERLYRLLYNEEMYLVAYQNIYSNEGNLTKATDNQTIDGMSLKRIEKIINTLKDEIYQLKPSRRTYREKKNGKMWPLGIPSFDDKLLQEVIRMILEAIYEGYFEETSHGFRQKKSCHTALDKSQKTFTGTKWFIEGDIKGFFDNINHNKMIEILRDRINDERFLRLIRKFLNAGYMENWKFFNTYSGTPQGGIISPILANIYLDKFDKYIKE